MTNLLLIALTCLIPRYHGICGQQFCRRHQRYGKGLKTWYARLICPASGLPEKSGQLPEPILYRAIQIPMRLTISLVLCELLIQLVVTFFKLLKAEGVKVVITVGP